jgi:uncharacterized protein (TIGR04141 family)
MAKQTHTLFLAKPDIDNFEALLSEKAQDRIGKEGTQVLDIDDFADGARLYVFAGDFFTPSWVLELRRHFPFGGNIASCSACALLMFRTEDHIFISTYAHGWMLVEENNIEGDFGLRVAINLLNDKKLKRLERANLGDALRGVSLSPFQRDFTSFGLDDALDLVRKISGSTRDDAAADTVTGAKSLKITGEFGIPDLPELAADALAAFGADAYKDTSFSVIDFVSPVMDRRLIGRLDEHCCQSIKDEAGEFELGLPSTNDSDSVGYKFQGPGHPGTHPELLLSNYTEALGEELATLTPKMLRDHKIGSIHQDSMRNRKWSIRQSLIGSIVIDTSRFAINEGEWYEVDQLFKDGIEERFQQTRQHWQGDPFPMIKAFDPKGRNGKLESEESYNRRLANHLGVCLLDRQLVAIPDIQRSNFEVCDLLDIPGKRFLHVKKSSRRSSVLSHFFKQGSNSAQQLKRFPAAWDGLLNVVQGLYGDLFRDQLIDAMADERRWTVEFLILDTPRHDGTFNIPFFSKITLRNEAISLLAQEYDVRLSFMNV